MTEAISNDNHTNSAKVLGASAAGFAALTLVESLIHGLIERGMITVIDAIEIVTTAEDVARGVRDESLEPLPDHNSALQMLTAIGVSLQIDAT